MDSSLANVYALLILGDRHIMDHIINGKTVGLWSMTVDPCLHKDQLPHTCTNHSTQNYAFYRVSVTILSNLY